MDKLNMRSMDKCEYNLMKLMELFPNAVTETISGYDDNGKPIIKRAIDKEVLMQEINVNIRKFLLNFNLPKDMRNG